MGEEVKLTDYNSGDDRLLWEAGLPAGDDLTPLTLQLIPPELASAFRISPETVKTLADVNRASENTFNSLHRHSSHELSPNETVTEGSDPVKKLRVGSGGAEDTEISSVANEDEGGAAAKAVKRARLVWTPQLHKRFVEVVAHLGVKSAVPKAIMQMMNVEGLTRENVASHLQKYRLYLKRMQGGNDSCESGEANGHVVGPGYPMYGGNVGFHHQYSMVQQGNNFGYYHPVASNDK